MSDSVHLGTVLYRSSQKCFIILFNFVTVRPTYSNSTTRNIFVCVVHFFVASNYTKLKIILFLNRNRKKTEPLKKKKNSDPGSRSGIREKPIPNTGCQKGIGFRIRIRNTWSYGGPWTLTRG